MIARDNERIIGDALRSVADWVDEMVVVDTGSNDRTPELAGRCGARVFHSPWCDDFAASRNESFAHATSEWILWIDTDDTVPKETGAGIRAILDAGLDDDVMGLILQVECPSSHGRSDGTLVDHVKVVRNHPAIRFEGRIHEQVLPSIRRLDGRVEWTSLRVVHSGVDRTEAGRKKKIERDLRILQLEHRDHPDHTFVLFNLGMTLLFAGKPDQARDALRRCVSLAHSGESHLRKAYALLVDSLMELGDTGEAQRLCWEALGRIPNDPELSFKLGRLEILNKDWELAVDALRRIDANADSRYFSSLDQGIRGYKKDANLAIAFEELGRLDEAIDAWFTCAQQNPGFEDAWEGILRLAPTVQAFNRLEPWAESLAQCDETLYLAFLIQALRHHWLGAPGVAAYFFQRSMDAQPSSKIVINEYARFLHERQEWELSLPILTRLLEHDVNDPAACFNTAHAMYRLGRFDEAETYAERSLAERPDHAPCAQLLAETRDMLKH